MRFLWAERRVQVWRGRDCRSAGPRVSQTSQGDCFHPKPCPSCPCTWLTSRAVWEPLPVPLPTLPGQDVDPGGRGALFHPRQLLDPAQGRGCRAFLLGAESYNHAGPPTSLNTGIERPEHPRAFECKQAVKYFKTWYFTRNGPSEGPKIHRPVRAQPQARWPGLPYVNKGKENSLAVSGAT